MTGDGDVEVVAFCRQLRPRLVGLLRLQVGDVAVAEELAQETLTRVWARWPRVRGLDKPDQWAFRVAVNLSTSWWRRHAAQRRAFHRRGMDRTTDNGHTEGFGEAELRDAVAALPTRQRQALVLRHYLQLDVADAAAVMGCATGTVQALCHQGAQGLRQAGVVATASEVTDG